MAYDFGINTLGIKNPFRVDGAARAIAGTAVFLLGVFALLGVSEELKTDATHAWISAIAGFVLMGAGLKYCSRGLFQLFRYFVGRSVPTSLAYNKAKSEKDNAETEKPYLAYTEQDLESMLMGRKNGTFVEPVGWLPRLIHSLLPRLIFTPHPIRNFAQELGEMVGATVTVFVAFGLAYFVSVSGLVGQAGVVITPVLSILLLVYLIYVWYSAARALDSRRVRRLNEKGASGIAKLLGVAILLPILIGFLFNQLDESVKQPILNGAEQLEVFNAWSNLTLLLIVGAVVLVVSGLMLIERFQLTNPLTEVSEFRDNMQESVHPNEVFINIENIVLANRRFKEIPNRIYQDFVPVLNEQSQGKGSFKGELLIETQPEFREIDYSPRFKLIRLGATVLSQVFVLLGALWFLYLADGIADLIQLGELEVANLEASGGSTATEAGLAISAQVSAVITLLFSWLTFTAAGRILSNGAFLFWSEMQFRSLLMWMKTEGTFTESKVSTGMAIHDSTRSENVVVRSSITPWIITSSITTSTFATSGMQNLEMPRYVMTMEKTPEEMNDIVTEIRTFLRDREAIASITSDRDLQNADAIYRVNQASRGDAPEQIGKSDSEAAGYLRQQDDDAARE